MSVQDIVVLFIGIDPREEAPSMPGHSVREMLVPPHEHEATRSAAGFSEWLLFHPLPDLEHQLFGNHYDDTGPKGLLIGRTFAELDAGYRLEIDHTQLLRAIDDADRAVKRLDPGLSARLYFIKLVG